MKSIDYIGNELELFSLAKNWKNYWAKQINPYIGESVLEIGAGLGATARVLNSKAYKKWVAIEPDKNLCALNLQLNLNAKSGKYLDIRNTTSIGIGEHEKFDTILYIDVLEHIEDDTGEIERVSNNLITGGRIIVLAPAHNFLFSKFDESVGHFRRYDKKTLLQIMPPGFILNKLNYLDSVGLLASLGNKFLLKSGNPTKNQILLWDRFMVRLSYFFDPIIGFSLGKSIVFIIQKV